MKRSPSVDKTDTVRVATYLRISTDEQNQPYSLDVQGAKLEAFIASQPAWVQTLRFEDQMSGGTLDRPALRQALAAAREHGYDLLLVYRVDRLARSIRGLTQIVEELDHAGIRFRSATEPFENETPAGRMMWQLLGVFAEFERAAFIQRITDALHEKAARGGWIPGRPCYGYRLTNDDPRRLDPDPAEAPLIPLIFDMYVNKRMGCRTIGRWLTQNGYRTRGGIPWGGPAVHTVLTNRAYLGETRFRDSVFTDRHPALVQVDVFDMAQVLMKERTEDWGRRRANTSDFVLSGLLTCGKCGNRLTGNAAHGRNARFRYYTCHRRLKYGIAHCDTDAIPAEALERAVLEALLQIYQTGDIVKDAVQSAYKRALEAVPNLQADLVGIEAEIRKSEDALDRYFLAFEAGRLSAEDCGARIDSLNTKLNALRRRRLEVEAQLGVAVPAAFDPQLLKSVVTELKDSIETGTPSQMKALLRSLVENIKVDGRDAIFPIFRVPAPPVRLVVNEVHQISGQPGVAASE